MNTFEHVVNYIIIIIKIISSTYFYLVWHSDVYIFDKNNLDKKQVCLARNFVSVDKNKSRQI